MIDEAKKDLVPSLILLAASFLLGMIFPVKLLALLPLIYFILYLFKSVKARGVYVPNRPPKKREFYENMFSYVHPVLMPNFIYILLGLVYMFFAVVLFLIVPVSRYFYNWSTIMFGMGSSKLEPVPADHSSAADDRKTPLPKRPQTTVNQAHTASAGPRRPGMQIPRIRREGSAVQNSQKAKEKAMEQSMLRQIESNYIELQNIRANSEKVLDSIFGGSKISKARYISGLDEAVEISRKNFEAAKDYVRVGHNLEILKKYYERSVQTNKKAADLLDSLVTHELGEMDDDFEDMTQRLDELQDSIKYYRTH